MACEICDWIEKKKLHVLYEDETLIAALTPKPAAVGHIMLFPKEHTPIIEQCTDPIIGKLGVVANHISTALFESLNIQGTNIMISNGIPAHQKYSHIVVDIIPRAENDGLQFEWAPKKLSDDEMGTAMLKIQENTKQVGIVEKEKKAPAPIQETQPENIPQQSDGEKENYLLKQLRRIP